MYFRPVSDHLQDLNKTPSYLKGKSRACWISNAKKVPHNCNYRQYSPPFRIPSVCYNIIYVHRFVNIDTLDIVIQHFRSCRLYSIDTKSCGDFSNLSLIQIHTIPTSLPSYVLFIHLHHLPPSNSLLFTKIQLLFQLVFSPNNILYSWGVLEAELEHGSSHSIFSFPIDAKCVNLQLEFRKWYTLAPSFCKTCKPHSNYHMAFGSSMFCRCKNHIYNDPSNMWSLKDAILYVTSCFLDRSETDYPWDRILDPQYTTLPLVNLEKMIHYALYDCLSVTYLRLPVSQCWALIQVEDTPIHILLTDSTHIISYPELEYVSDEELPPIIKPPSADDEQRQGQNQTRIEVSVSELLIKNPTSSDQNSSSLPSDHLKKHARSSSKACVQKKRERRKKLNQHCYQHHIFRFIYHQFTIPMVKDTLRQMQIEFLRVKRKRQRLKIGVKDSAARDKVDALLPLDIFDRSKYDQR